MMKKMMTYTRNIPIPNQLKWKRKMKMSKKMRRLRKIDFNEKRRGEKMWKWKRGGMYSVEVEMSKMKISLMSMKTKE